MQVTGLAVSDRHPYMFSAGLDKMVKCWDLEYNKVRRRPVLPSSTILPCMTQRQMVLAKPWWLPAMCSSLTEWLSCHPPPPPQFCPPGSSPPFPLNNNLHIKCHVKSGHALLLCRAEISPAILQLLSVVWPLWHPPPCPLHFCLLGLLLRRFRSSVKYFVLGGSHAAGAVCEALHNTH